VLETLTSLNRNSFYLVAIVLFIIGFYTMLANSNLIKKILGLNIMESAIFLFFVSIGYVAGGKAPIVSPGAEGAYVNPIPAALILNGIVVAVSVTAYSLSLIIKIYEYYGTVDAEEIMLIRSRENES